MGSSRNAGQDRCQQHWEPLCPSCWLCKTKECFPAPHPFSSLLCTTWFFLGVNGAAEGSLIQIKSLLGGTAGIQRALGNVWNWNCIINCKYIDGDESSWHPLLLGSCKAHFQLQPSWEFTSRQIYAWSDFHWPEQPFCFCICVNYLDFIYLQPPAP